MSGGQRQRVGIARALALSPNSSSATSRSRRSTSRSRRRSSTCSRTCSGEFGLAFLFIGHDLSVVRHLCQRVAVMYLGRLVEIADADELFDHPMHPYTQALLAAVPEPDPVAERARHASDPAGRGAEPAEPAFRLRVPPAVPARRARLPRARSRTAGAEARPFCGVPGRGKMRRAVAATRRRETFREPRDSRRLWRANRGGPYDEEHGEPALGRGASRRVEEELRRRLRLRSARSAVRPQPAGAVRPASRPADDAPPARGRRHALGLASDAAASGRGARPRRAAARSAPAGPVSARSAPSIRPRSTRCCSSRSAPTC